jgi:hypothetical protein
MHRKRIGWHRALGAQVAVERVASWATVDTLNRPNLDDAVAVQRVQAGSLGIDDDFTHGALLLAEYLCIVGAGARGFQLTDARSRVPEVSN